MKRALVAVGQFAVECVCVLLLSLYAGYRIARMALGIGRPRKPRLSSSVSLNRAFTNHRNRLAREDELWSRR